MAVRRISELDKVTQASINDRYSPATSPFSKFIFETSELNKEATEELYYVSKQIDWGQLSSLLLKDVWAVINELSGIVKGLNIGNTGQNGDLALSIIEDWSRYGLPGTLGYPINNISCSGLSVTQDIHGCALSSKWA